MTIDFIPEKSPYSEVLTTELISVLETHDDSLNLGESSVFLEFPVFREDENLILTNLLLISPNYGVVLFETYNGPRGRVANAKDACANIESLINNLFSKFVKISKLRKRNREIAFSFNAALYGPDISENLSDFDDIKILKSQQAIIEYLESIRCEEPLENEKISEIISVIDGSKALSKPKERLVTDKVLQKKADIINRLEAEIRKFDKEQRVGYMVRVDGPQRIQGIAGSGKTVVLAMKAALEHINNPDARIIFTFYTKSLYQHVKQLIRRFYRQFEEKDPDWDKLQIMHAWGGDWQPGLYYTAAKAFGERPLTYGQANSLSSKPFDFACKQLLDKKNIKGIYDFIFVDEAQDFDSSFLQLALNLAVEKQLVIAYDIFQNIYDVESPSSSVLFGVNDAGEPNVHFDQDIMLHTCYRNPREILVCAHAIGFGIYGSKIVQMLESEDHWKDFGYDLVEGELVSNQKITITRNQDFSPSSISLDYSIEQIIRVNVLESLQQEVNHVLQSILNDLEQGLSPEDILVICADDNNQRAYLAELAEQAAPHDIKINNLQAQSMSLKDFQEIGKVTFSSIYKAKGNEAYSVYILGIDGLFRKVTPRTRNMAFTAMTRAKGWLSISGIGQDAKAFEAEIQTAKMNFPNLVFTYPDSEQLKFMKRDLAATVDADAKEILDQLEFGLGDRELEMVLSKKLKELRKNRASINKTK